MVLVVKCFLPQVHIIVSLNTNFYKRRIISDGCECHLWKHHVFSHWSESGHCSNSIFLPTICYDPSSLRIQERRNKQTNSWEWALNYQDQPRPIFHSISLGSWEPAKGRLKGSIKHKHRLAPYLAPFQRKVKTLSNSINYAGHTLIIL